MIVGTALWVCRVEFKDDYLVIKYYHKISVLVLILLKIINMLETVKSEIVEHRYFN